MNLSTFILSCLLIVGCLTLHQQQTSVGAYDENAELAQLSKQQEQFETQLTAMQSDLGRVTDQLKNSESDEQKVGILEDAVTRHR
jgi:outer membrane murein-binding lipoprotein Lpp